MKPGHRQTKEKNNAKPPVRKPAQSSTEELSSQELDRVQGGVTVDMRKTHPK
jgi:hypothetical protein